MKKETVIVGCIYRPPPGNNFAANSLVDNEINLALRAAKSAVHHKKNTGLLIAGHFNFPYVKWLNDGSVSVFGNEDSPGSKFIELLNGESLYQHVNKPTFRKANGSLSNTLDYIITDSPYRKHYVNDSAPLGAREQAHLTLTWEYQLATCTSEVSISCRYKYNQVEYAKLNKAFETANWDKIFTEQDVNSS
ncbi:RNA-directed DNA polymerase from mobile element jockey-like, partial [Brachionus plicatilis]